MTEKEAQEILVQLGKILKGQRRTLGITQRSASTMLGIKYQMLQKHEYGMANISVPRYIEICRNYGLEPGATIDALDRVTRRK